MVYTRLKAHFDRIVSAASISLALCPCGGRTLTGGGVHRDRARRGGCSIHSVLQGVKDQNQGISSSMDICKVMNRSRRRRQKSRPAARKGTPRFRFRSWKPRPAAERRGCFDRRVQDGESPCIRITRIFQRSAVLWEVGSWESGGEGGGDRGVSRPLTCCTERGLRSMAEFPGSKCLSSHQRGPDVVLALECEISSKSLVFAILPSLRWSDCGDGDEVIGLHSNYCNLTCAKIMPNIPQKKIRNHLRHSCYFSAYGKAE